MSRNLLAGGLFLALLGATAAARAEAPPAEQVLPAERPVRVRASHRVDVIAPGERIDTVIDRMRAGPAPTAAAAEAKPSDRAPVRGPDHARGPEHGPGREKAQRGAGGSHLPAQAGSSGARPQR